MYREKNFLKGVFFAIKFIIKALFNVDILHSFPFIK